MTEIITYRKLSELSNWERNYRVGDVSAIVTSIVTFGFNGALRVWKDGIVIAGNHALKALNTMKANGATVPRGVQVDNGEWFVPCVDVSHLNRTQANGFAIADNRTQALGHDDNEALATLLQELKNDDEELFKAVGYDDDALKELIDGLTHIPTELPETDGEQVNKADELQTVWQVKRGDVWQVGKHRIMCGDSTSAEDVARLMDGAKAKLVLTDPPYGVGRDKGFGGQRPFNGQGVKHIASRRYNNDDWDSERPTKDTFDLLLEQSDEAIIWGGNFFADLLPVSTHWVVWDKLQTMPTFGDCELAWTNISRKSVKKFTVEYNGLIGKEKERFHPTQKPVKLFVDVLNEYSETGNSVLDIYLGSGTTAVACEQTGRVCYGMEIHPPYVAVTLERLKNMGLTPERIEATHAT